MPHVGMHCRAIRRHGVVGTRALRDPGLQVNEGERA